MNWVGATRRGEARSKHPSQSDAGTRPAKSSRDDPGVKSQPTLRPVSQRSRRRGHKKILWSASALREAAIGRALAGTPPGCAARPSIRARREWDTRHSECRGLSGRRPDRRGRAEGATKRFYGAHQRCGRPLSEELWQELRQAAPPDLPFVRAGSGIPDIVNAVAFQGVGQIAEVAPKGPQKDSMERISAAGGRYRKSFGRNSARLRRQTFHSCAPGVGYQT